MLSRILLCNQTATGATEHTVRRKIAPDGQIARQPLRTRCAADQLIEREDSKCEEEEENHCQEVGKDDWPANHPVLFCDTALGVLVVRSVPARCLSKSCSFDARCEVAQNPVLLLSRHKLNTSSYGRSNRCHMGKVWPEVGSSLVLRCNRVIISTASGEDLCGSVPARHQIHQDIDYTWSRKIQDIDKFKYGGDDGVNLCAPQRTVLPLVSVHRAVVKSESADFEVEVITSNAGCEMQRDAIHLRVWDVWLSNRTENIPARRQSLCYSVGVWNASTQDQVIHGLSDQRNQEHLSLSNHHLNKASSGVRSILPPDRGSAAQISVLRWPNQLGAAEPNLAFTANPTLAPIIPAAASDEDTKDNMLQSPQQREASYNDDEHSGPRSRPRGSLPIDQHTECYKLEVFPVQYYETSSVLEGPANLCHHPQSPQINSKPFIPSQRAHNLCHNLSTPFQSSFDGSENYTSNRRRRNRDRRRLERELCCLRMREDQSKEDRGRRLEHLQSQLEQYQSAKVDPPANIADRQTSTNYVPHVLLLLLLLLCKPTPVNA